VLAVMKLPDPFLSQRSLTTPVALSVLTALGAVLAGIVLFDVYQDWVLEGNRLWTTLAENLLPLALALSVPILGWRWARSGQGETYAAETAKWALAGGTYTIVVCAVVLGFQVVQGEVKPLIILVQLTIVGVAGGLFVGYVLARVKTIRNEYREKEARLRGLADTIPGVVYQLSVHANGTREVRFVGDHAEGLLGISAEPEGFYERFMEHVPEPDREPFRTAVERALDEGREWKLEVPFQRPDGERLWLLDRSAVERQNGGYLFSGVVLDVTERKESERELETHREYSGDLIDAVDDVFFVYDAEGRLRRWNESFMEVTGYSSDELDTMHGTDFVPPAARERAAARIADVFETGHARLEAPVLRKDGTTVPYEFVASRVEHPDGGARLVGVGRDISERMEKEQALRRSERQFEALFHDPNILVTLLDPDGTVLDVNETAMRYVDQPLDNIEGTPLWSTLWFAGDEALGRDVRRWIDEAAAGEYVEFEANLSMTIGDEMTVEGVFRPVRNEAGDVASLLVSCRDVTKRRRRRERLLLHDRMLNEVGQAVIATDPEGDITFWNRAAERVYGWPEEEALGRNVLDLTVPGGAQVEARDIMTTLSNGNSWSGEFEARRKDGSTFPVLVTDTPVFNDGGELAGVIGVTTDITDRKVREQELKAAKEEAERMSRLKSAFLANMSHEIRTPLTAIIGFAEVIGEQVGEDEKGPVPRFTRLIERSGHRLLKTLNGVLNLSKLEAGEIDLQLEPINLAAEVAEVAEEFRAQAKTAEIDLRVRTGSATWARADAGFVQIVLRNLVSNAVKYTRAGGTVQVRVAEDEEAATLEVEDTGIGMDPARAEELFEPFRQASEGLEREYEGTGLGLAVTREAVDQMDGTIEVETQKGEGSRFTVRLPQAENPDEKVST